MDRLPLLEETVRFWQPRAQRTLTQEDARQMVENVVGFFATLQRWSAAAGNRSYETNTDREAA
jgi:hypothetical protein